MYLKSCFAKDIKNKDKLCLQCVDIANKANFNTDFQDVYDHLFADDLMLVFAFDDNKTMQGFSSMFLTKEDDGTPHLHLNGIIVSPQMQGKGVAKLMVSRAIGYIYGMYNKTLNDNFKISISARTQNPAIYRLLSSLSNTVSPNENGVVKSTHKTIIKKMYPRLKLFLGQFDKNFVVINAYSSPKIQANISNQKVKDLFTKLGNNDAFIIFGDRVNNLNLEQLEHGIEDCKQIQNNNKNDLSFN